MSQENKNEMPEGLKPVWQVTIVQEKENLVILIGCQVATIHGHNYFLLILMGHQTMIVQTFFSRDTDGSQVVT